MNQKETAGCHAAPDLMQGLSQCMAGVRALDGNLVCGISELLVSRVLHKVMAVL